MSKRNLDEMELVVSDRSHDELNVFCVAYGKMAQNTVTMSTYPDKWVHADQIEKKMFPSDLGPKGDSHIFFINRMQFDRNGQIFTFQGSVYRVEEEPDKKWVQVTGEHDQKRFNVEFSPYEQRVRLEENAPFGRIVVKETWANAPLLEFEVDSKLDVRIMDENYHDTGECFVSLFSVSGDNVGIVMNPNCAEKFLIRVQSILDELKNPVVEEKKPFYVCMGLVNKAQKDGNMRAMVLVAKKENYHNWYPVMKHNMGLIFARKEVRAEENLREMYLVLNSIKIPTEQYTSQEKMIYRWILLDREKTLHKANCEFVQSNADPTDLRKFDFVFNLALFEDEMGDEKLSIAKLLTKFKDGLMVIFNAMFQERRIMFFTRNQSVSEMARTVFSAVLLVSPPLTGLLQYRVFPLCTMDDLRFTKVNGYIAGVCDPDFEKQEDLWDIFVNIDTGKIIKNRDTYPEGNNPPYEKLDKHFAKIILELTHSHVMKRLKVDYTDHCLRAHFRSYTADLIQMAIGSKSTEGGMDESKKNAIEINFSRIENWKKTYSYSFYLKKLELEREMSVIDGKELEELERVVSLLKVGHCNEEVIEKRILKTLHKLRPSRELLLEFLSYFPLAQGGLYPLAVFLFHSKLEIRNGCASFMKKLEGIKEGSCAIAQLNVFLQLQYDRTVRWLGRRVRRKRIGKKKKVEKDPDEPVMDDNQIIQEGMSDVHRAKIGQKKTIEMW